MHDAAADMFTTGGQAREVRTRTPGRAATSAAEARGGRGTRACGPRLGEIALVAAVTVVIVATVLLAGRGSQGTSAMTTRAVRVGAGETLWRLAESNPVPGQNTAATVAQIRAINGLRTSAVAQGVTLRVPAEEARDTSFASR